MNFKEKVYDKQKTFNIVNFDSYIQRCKYCNDFNFNIVSKTIWSSLQHNT